MTSNKNTYELSIAGVTFKLKTLHDESTVQELVEFVNTRIGQAMGSTRSGSLQNAAVLAALNIAEEFHDERRRLVYRLKMMEERALRLVGPELEKPEPPLEGDMP